VVKEEEGDNPIWHCSVSVSGSSAVLDSLSQTVVFRHADSENLAISGAHDVRVRRKVVGICGSDVHYLRVRACYLLL
jgi:hypothetical protein